MTLREWFRIFLKRTEPRDAEKHFGTEDTVKAFNDVRKPDAVRVRLDGS